MLYQPAKKLFLGEKVQAGTSSYQPNKELFLGKQVQAGTCLPRNNALASWYKLVSDATSPPSKTTCRRNFTGFFINAPIFMITSVNPTAQQLV
ncbi:hypothetical protein PCANC_04266 [Puccinia coronata f. sp. avenae]|uniref:Uncharacterized protein n=1 Tax=Puccinia coronata f. sp. avenae TaxID=200324 RepID=A0A2N5VX13_9BASI|nr:hypothetical protein PCANC_04266 [Puccinia coronata f. sp. avenae]